MTTERKAPKKWVEYSKTEQRNAYILLGVLASILLIVLFAACNGPKQEAAPPAPVVTSAPAEPKAEPVPAERPASEGKPEVFDRIKAETNCTSLQEGFDRSYENGNRARNQGQMDLAKANTAYMAAYLERQKELGCVK